MQSGYCDVTRGTHLKHQSERVLQLMPHVWSGRGPAMLNSLHAMNASYLAVYAGDVGTSCASHSKGYRLTPLYFVCPTEPQSLSTEATGKSNEGVSFVSWDTAQKATNSSKQGPAPTDAGHTLFWPWGSSEHDALILNRQIRRLPVIVSLLGRLWHPAKARLSRYKYQMYSNTGGGGDMR